MGSQGSEDATVEKEKSAGTRSDRKFKKTSTKAPWGNREGLFSEGYTIVPNKFFFAFANLRPPLTHGELLFVLRLMTFKWDEAAPHLSYQTLANLMGVNEKTVQRYAQALCRKKYLYGVFQLHATNRFDLTNFFAALATAPSVYVGRKPKKPVEPKD